MPGVIAAEALVVLIETLILRWALPVSFGRAVLTSALANGASAAGGIALDHLVLLPFDSPGLPPFSRC